MIDFVIGGLVTNSDFMFREDFIDDLWDSLRKNNILLLAPRRMGKTSVMFQLLDNPKDNRIVIHLNVEELESPGDFCLHLIDAFHEYHPEIMRKALKATWHFISDILDRVEVDTGDFKIALRKSGFIESWNERSNQLITRLNTWCEKQGKEIVFLIDELPDMLIRMQKKSPEELETFLHWFRKVRIAPKSKIRWLIAGSVNIEGTLAHLGQLKTINDLEKEILPPFTEEEVGQFVTQMLKQRDVLFDPQITSQIKNLLGSPIPVFLQLFTQELYRFWKRSGKKKIEEQHVIHVFEKSLLGEKARDKFQHYRTRIKLHYNEEDKDGTYKILDHLSVSENGLSRNKLFLIFKQIEEQNSNPRNNYKLQDAFDSLMLFLESDFYVKETDDGKYDFSSKLLKTWWKKYYGYCK
jgi:hypothetical protein